MMLHTPLTLARDTSHSSVPPGDYQVGTTFQLIKNISINNKKEQKILQLINLINIKKIYQ